jgi:hypothetical protein
MSALLFVVGAVAVVAGVGMVGYGIPINEFSFGNTLIVSGTTAAVGGLIVIAIGAAVAQLQKISETLAGRNLVGSGRPLDTFEPAAMAVPSQPAGRIPFPPRPKSEAPMRDPYPVESRMAPAEFPREERAPAPAAPTMRNPEMASAAEYDEVSLSPGHADLREPARPAPSYSNGNGSAMPDRYHDAGAEAAWAAPPPPPPPRRAPAQPSQFDNMWPAEARSADAKPAEPRPARAPQANEARNEPKREMSPPGVLAPPRPAGETRSVAILKSGVVDGMGYTLYVDGSIEAELPQGTLRFASINDLRNHLSKGA